jgi:hypothetical protein
VAEHADGRLEILEWAKLRSWSVIDRSRKLPTPAEEALPEPAVA